MQNNDDQTCSFKKKKKTFCEVFFFLERFIERFTNVIKKSNAFQKKKRCLFSCKNKINLKTDWMVYGEMVPGEKLKCNPLPPPRMKPASEK